MTNIKDAHKVSADELDEAFAKLPSKLQDYMRYQAVTSYSTVLALKYLEEGATEEQLIESLQRDGAQKWFEQYGREWQFKFPPYRDTSELIGRKS